MFLLLLPLTILAALLTQDNIPPQALELLATAFAFGSLIMGDIAFTGLIRRALALADIPLKGEGARVLSWAVCLALIVVSVSLDWYNGPGDEGLGPWLVGLWPVASALANVIRDKYFAAPSAPSAPAIVEVVTRSAP